MNIITCIINLFRTNKDIPNPRPKPLPYYEMNKLEWKPDRIIIHNPSFVVSKAIVDALNRLKISEALSISQKSKEDISVLNQHIYPPKETGT